ncbi:MAG TPA: dTMP kinase [Candidatus Paceibacterota bacterium]|nr:dTMP kinase [Candidatus Paceibacterota bacterium]
MNNQPIAIGSFVVVAGCEGAGKTTHMERLKSLLPNAKFFREPGGTKFAEEEMRRLMLKSEYSSGMSPYQHMNLVFAGREDNVRAIVIPARTQGIHVFADRFDCCSFAYQVHGMEGDHLLEHFQSCRRHMGPEWCLPSLYIILDVSPEVGMKRVALRAAAKGEVNHFDERGPEFHARVREGYKHFAKLYPEKVVIIDAERSKEEVWKDIEKTIAPFIS